MNKTDLAAEVAKKTGMTRKKSEEIITVTVESIVDALVAGNKVQIAGLGGFEVKERPEHEGHNPQSGEKITVAASRNVRFKAGKTLKDSLQ